MLFYIIIIIINYCLDKGLKYSDVKFLYAVFVFLVKNKKRGGTRNNDIIRRQFLTGRIEIFVLTNNLHGNVNKLSNKGGKTFSSGRSQKRIIGHNTNV